MDQFDDDAWIKAREEAIEKMWTERVPCPARGPSEITEDDLPY
jgi:hypothetical protein